MLTQRFTNETPQTTSILCASSCYIDRVICVVLVDAMIIAVIIISLIILYGFFWYVDKVIQAKHDEMMKTYEHSCNGGLTDEEMEDK